MNLKKLEELENFLNQKGILLSREDLYINNLSNNTIDKRIITLAEQLKNDVQNFYEYALVYKLPVFGQGDCVSKFEISSYITFLYYMLEKIGFKDFIKNYEIVFNYFIHDHLDKDGKNLKIGTLRAIVLFNKPKDMERSFKNKQINYNWLIDPTNKDYLFPYLLFTGYQSLYLNTFYQFLRQKNNILLNLGLKVEEKENVFKELLGELFFTSGGMVFIYDRYKKLLESYTNEFLKNGSNSVFNLVRGGILRKEEVIQHYINEDSFHLHRHFEIYSCKFVSENFYNNINSFKMDPIEFKKNMKFHIEEFYNSNKTISMYIDWKHFLTVVYALEDALLIEQKDTVMGIDGSKPTPIFEKWHIYKTILNVGNINKNLEN